jgi:hypothetical protein
MRISDCGFEFAPPRHYGALHVTHTGGNEMFFKRPTLHIDKVKNIEINTRLIEINGKIRTLGTTGLKINLFIVRIEVLVRDLSEAQDIERTTRGFLHGING